MCACGGTQNAGRHEGLKVKTKTGLLTNERTEVTIMKTYEGEQVLEHEVRQ